MVSAIRPEWIFLQLVTWDIVDAFTGVGEMIDETFLPCLFFGKKKTLSPIVGALSKILVKKSRLGVLNPLTSSQEKYLSYMWGSADLIRSVTGGGAFSNVDHLQTLSEKRRDRKKYRDVACKSILKGLVSNLKGTNKRLLLPAKSTCAWMIVCGTTVSGTVLSATEFWVF